MSIDQLIPLNQLPGPPVNGEQRAYLEGLFAGLRQRGVRFDDVTPNPAALPTSPSASSDLIAEERIKRELHPLDAYPLLLEDAATNRAPGRENVFRFKWHGLFYLSPNKEAFMARLRIPAGQLKSSQLREISRIAQELTTGYVQITTRANLQIRLIEPKNAPEFLRRIQSIGLHTRGAGADNVRNITASATAGIDLNELIDVIPFCQQLAQLIINNREFYDLPRKFNIAFDGGGLIPTLEDTNDIGLKAVRVAEGAPGLAPGIYFRVQLGGATGHQAFARDLGVLVPPSQIVQVTTALLRVYIAQGNRTDRKRARLKHLLEHFSLDRYLAETEKLLGYALLRVPLDAQGQSPLHPTVPLPGVPHPHVGIFAQKQPGLNYVGAAVPVGHLTPKQLMRLAELSDLYGTGEIRLTVWQNLVIPNVPDAYVETLKRALVKTGLHWEQSNIRSGVVACTGNAYCKFASADTKRHALDLVDHLEKRFKLDQPINIHLTGCSNSCAQHYIGDIGLLGTKVKVAGESVEGYHVFLGGGFGSQQAVGRQVFTGVSVGNLKPTLEKIVRAFLNHRQPGESFRSFTTRHDLNALQALFS